MELFSTITNVNDRNGAPCYNEKIRDTIHKGIAEGEVDVHNITPDAHNVTVDIFSQTPNTQR